MHKPLPISKIILTVTILIIAITLTLVIVQYFSKPPSMDKNRAELCGRIISIASHHKEWGDFTLWNNGELTLWSADKRGANEVSNDDINAMAHLLIQSSTMMLYRVDDTFFFKLQPRFLFLKTPGYIYSQRGIHRSKKNSHFLDIASPLRSLHDGWYSSADINKGARLR